MLRLRTENKAYDDSPPGKPDAGHQARPDCGVPSVQNCSSAIFRDPSFVCLIQTGHTTGPRHYRIRSARNFSTRHCSLRPTPHMTQYWQAAACPRAAQQKRRRTEVSVPHSGSPGTVGRHNNTPKRVCIRCVCHKHPPHPRPRAACGARLLIERRKPFKFLQGIQ